MPADHEIGDNDCFEPAGYSSLPVAGAGGQEQHAAMVAGMKLHLPLDEDDYLMPSNGQQPTPAGYMDLAGDYHKGGRSQLLSRWDAHFFNIFKLGYSFIISKSNSF